MKKFLTALLCVVSAAIISLGFAACGKSGKTGITVYVPDGAPALAVAKLMHENESFGKDVTYRVVGASEIGSCVTFSDDDKNADLCILPVNTASKLLGDGERYKMLGTVTHGNLFIVSSADKADVTNENFVSNIAGKKVGVVNLSAFPGAVFKLILNEYGVAQGDVTLENVTPAEVNGNSGYDYFVMPEPAASTRTGNANLNLKIAGNLQSLYGGGGYPQAVLVAKTSLIDGDPKFISDFTAAMQSSAEWLVDEDINAQAVIYAITAHFADSENTAPTFNANNLTKRVIENCAVNFVSSESCREEVESFLEKLRAAGDAAATAVPENFFYLP